MNIYLVKFRGYYLGGQMLVIAETQRKAFNKAKKELLSLNLLDKNKDFSLNNVTEISCDKEQIIVIDNGDH